MNGKSAVGFCLVLGLLSSCASYMKRKECEKSNWFSIGEQAALRGERPDADKFVQECKAVEADFNSSDLDRGFKKGMAQYCTADQAVKTGKEGLVFNEEFCEPADLRVLKVKYLQGLNDYCSESGGKRIGSEGKVYTKICKGEQELSFLKGYQPARKNYLVAAAKSMERELLLKQKEADSKEERLIRLGKEKSRLQARLTRTKMVPTVDPVTGKEKYSWVEVEDSSASSQIDFLNMQEHTLESEISKLRREMDTMSKSISAMEAEAAAL